MWETACAHSVSITIAIDLNTGSEQGIVLTSAVAALNGDGLRAASRSSFLRFMSSRNSRRLWARACVSVAHPWFV